MVGSKPTVLAVRRIPNSLVYPRVMASDHFLKLPEPVQWDEIQTIVKNYLGEALVDFEAPNKKFFMVTLAGIPSHPFQDIARARAVYEPQMSRWIEFTQTGKKKFAVTTRLADEYTNCVASGIAKCLARWYQADLEEPG